MLLHLLQHSFECTSMTALSGSVFLILVLFWFSNYLIIPISAKSDHNRLVCQLSGLWCLCASELNLQQYSGKRGSPESDSPRLRLHRQNKEPVRSWMPWNCFLCWYNYFGIQRCHCHNSKSSSRTENCPLYVFLSKLPPPVCLLTHGFFFIIIYFIFFWAWAGRSILESSNR